MAGLDSNPCFLCQTCRRAAERAVARPSVQLFARVVRRFAAWAPDPVPPPVETIVVTSVQEDLW